MPVSSGPRKWLAAGLLGLCLAAHFQAWSQPAQPAQPPFANEALRLRIVGGLANVSQYLRHEEPFWTQTLGRLSAGRYTAGIVPFDRAGVPGQDMLTLIRLGVVPFGTALLGLVAGQYPELSAPDLAALSPDVATLRKVVDAFRPALASAMRERHGAELLAVYMYPAQVVFCREPLRGLTDLSGRRTRVSSSTQSDFVVSVGGIPVLMPFSEVTASIRSGSTDCAITGATSGKAIGLPAVTKTIYTLPVSWGVAVFGANLDVWRSLPEDLRALLLKEMPKLEAAIWEEAERESDFARPCNATTTCAPGSLEALAVVRPSQADQLLRKRIFERQVLPGWVERCGPDCTKLWDTTIGPVVGIKAPPYR
ncbi:TRAP transporter substrate-binding protein [Variovorax sp. RHLX14]|uniref:TRAP transporter substrate-binding protein n=1 Tax=Variovorax sp. RHLX14 TaxID=1259731 RepID=UPI003F44CAF0